MRRLNGIVLSIATLLAAGPALAAPDASVLDPFEIPSPALAFTQQPDLARFTTIGSPDGRVFVALPDETAAAIDRVQAMMVEANTGWSEVIEVQVLTTSADDDAAVAALIARDPRLSALPVSHRVLDRLPAAGARMGIVVLVSSARAVATIGR